MKPSGWVWATLAAGATGLAACGNEVTVLSEPTGGAYCTPGSTQPCYRPGQCAGAQVCSADGTAWSSCYCGAGASGDTGGYGAAGNAGGWGAYGAYGNAGGFGATGNWGGYGAYGNAGGWGASGNWGGYGAYGNAAGWGGSENWGGYGGAGNAGGWGADGGFGGSLPCVTTDEICNGVDDNGNDVADEGCPIGLVLDTSHPWTSPFYGSAIGTHWGPWPAAPAPISLLHGRSGCYLDRLVLTADVFTLQVDENTIPYSYSVLVQHGGTTVLGGDGGEPYSGTCGGTNRVIVGVLGSSGDGDAVDSIGGHCAAVHVVGQASCQYEVLLANAGSFGPLGHDPSCAYAAPFDQRCPPGYVVGAWTGYVDWVVYGLQFTCYPLRIIVK